MRSSINPSLSGGTMDLYAKENLSYMARNLKSNIYEFYDDDSTYFFAQNSHGGLFYIKIPK